MRLASPKILLFNLFCTFCLLDGVTRIFSTFWDGNSITISSCLAPSNHPIPKRRKYFGLMKLGSNLGPSRDKRMSWPLCNRLFSPSCPGFATENSPRIFHPWQSFCLNSTSPTNQTKACTTKNYIETYSSKIFLQLMNQRSKPEYLTLFTGSEA